MKKYVKVIGKANKGDYLVESSTKDVYQAVGPTMSQMFSKIDTVGQALQLKVTDDIGTILANIGE